MSNTTKPRMRSMFDLAYDRARMGSSMFKKLQSHLSLPMSAKPSNMFAKSKSWHTANAKGGYVVPRGCISVYVGPEKQRFVIKTEYVNHPVFKMLLDDAELEYGFKNEGPLLLPCEVDLFCKVLAEMDNSDEEFGGYSGCGSVYGPCSPFSPARRLVKSGMAKGCSSYAPL